MNVIQLVRQDTKYFRALDMNVTLCAYIVTNLFVLHQIQRSILHSEIPREAPGSTRTCGYHSGSGAPGAPCQFPFERNGINYVNQCSYHSENHGLICQTETGSWGGCCDERKF